jgi:hypothetical protein
MEGQKVQQQDAFLFQGAHPFETWVPKSQDHNLQTILIGRAPCISIVINRCVMEGVVPKQANIQSQSAYLLNIFKVAKNGKAPWNIVDNDFEGTAPHDSEKKTCKAIMLTIVSNKEWLCSRNELLPKIGYRSLDMLIA